MQGVPFASFAADYMKLKAMEQDLKSALYAIHPVPADEPQHYIVLFPNLVEGSIEFNILTAEMMDLRLLAQVPNDVLIHLGSLLQQVDDWSEGKEGCLYPHSQHQFPTMEVTESSDIGEDRLDDLQRRETEALRLIEDSKGTTS